jgi:dTDP-4-dehydrorhamnose 3,5-epimerase
MLKNKIKISRTKIIKNSKGDILKTFDRKNINFNKLNEIYFSWVKHNSIKAWKLHKKMTLYLHVPFGKVKFVFFDEKNKSFYSTTIGEKNFKVIRLKPNTWFGFKGVKNKNLIMSCSTLKHKKNEILRKNVKQIKYNW